MKFKLILSLLIITMQANICAYVSSGDTKENNVKQKNEKVESLLQQMTLEEKIGQLVQVVGADKVGTDWIREGKVGSYLIGTRGAYEANRLQKIAVEESRLGIPLLFANDVIHGYNTIFPIPLAESCSWNPELIEKAASIAAQEAAAEGTHWTYAPMVDIARDPRWGRIMEGSGEDPYLGSILAAARVKGFQGNSLEDKETIAACAKHFVAYGAAEAGKDYNTVDISERVLREIYLEPFHTAVKSGVATLMSAFNDIGGIPASANKFTLKDILRGEWNFNGFVISDFNSVAELIPHGIAADKKEAALKGFINGVDMDMVGDTLQGNIYSPNLKELVDEGKIPLEFIDNSVRSILSLKYELGLFENPYTDSLYFAENLPSQEERDKITLELARESIVLLKNEEHPGSSEGNKILPLSKNIKSIALIGPLADNKADLLGSWACDGRDSNVVSILEGIKSKVSSSTKINYIEGTEIMEEKPEEFAKAIEMAKNSEVVVLAIGEGKWMSGEAASRTDITIPEEQLNLAKRLHETGKPVIVLLFNGRPLAVNWLKENVPAIVECWFLGDQTGNAVADVLFGDFNPVGKLTVTFPRNTGQIPIYYNHKNTGRPPTDFKYTSKYLFTPVTPLYPFGYGLSYTKYEYSNLKLNSKKIKKDDVLEISVDIKNTGDREGTEIVQLYICDKVASVTRSVKELKAFKRVTIKPDETETVSFELNPEQLSFYNIDMKKIIEPGEFEVMVGTNSSHTINDNFYIVE